MLCSKKEKLFLKTVTKQTLNNQTLICHAFQINHIMQPLHTRENGSPQRNHLDLYHDESLIQRIMAKNGSVHFKCSGTSPHP